MAERFVLQFDEDSETFSETPDKGELDTDSHSYLVIDESEKKMTMAYRAGISIVMKRKIERRVNSYSKSGYDMGSKRIGMGFPLEQVNADEELPDILLTHGHTFGRRLVRDEIPAHAEPEPNMDIVPGIAGTKTDVSADAKKFTDIQTNVPSAMPAKSAPAATASSKPEPKPAAAPAPVGNTVDLVANSSTAQSSDDAVWALGQFLDQYARQGKVCVVTFEEAGKFRLVTLSDKEMKVPESNVSGNFRIDDVNLFEL